MSLFVEHRALWSGLVSEADDAEVGVLGIPFDNAASWRGGARHAPQQLRNLTPNLVYYTEEGTLLMCILEVKLWEFAGLRLSETSELQSLFVYTLFTIDLSGSRIQCEWNY